MKLDIIKNKLNNFIILDNEDKKVTEYINVKNVIKQKNIYYLTFYKGMAVEHVVQKRNIIFLKKYPKSLTMIYQKLFM